MEGLRRHQDRVRFVLVHHEEAAAFMATGYAKSTGRLGICTATSGPGAIHLLNGLYDAKLDHVPVLAITGMRESQMLGTGYQQEVAPRQALHGRCRIQRDDPRADAGAHARRPGGPPRPSRRGVVHLTFPTDIQIADADANPWEAPAPATIKPTAPIYRPAPGIPSPGDLRAAADVLNAGAKVAMLWAPGPCDARARCSAVADALGSPIIKSLPGKAAIPDDHPLDGRRDGIARHCAREDVVDGCDPS